MGIATYPRIENVKDQAKESTGLNWPISEDWDENFRVLEFLFEIMHQALWKSGGLASTSVGTSLAGDGTLTFVDPVLGVTMDGKTTLWTEAGEGLNLNGWGATDGDSLVVIRASASSQKLVSYTTPTREDGQGNQVGGEALQREYTIAKGAFALRPNTTTPLDEDVPVAVVNLASGVWTLTNISYTRPESHEMWYHTGANNPHPQYGFVDLKVAFDGAPAASEERWTLVGHNCTIYQADPGVVLADTLPSDGDYVIDIKLSGIFIGTVTIAIDGTVTWALTTNVPANAGEKLELIAPATPDSTLADVQVVFYGERNVL